MLKGNQKKIDKNKNNRIDAEDFKILKAEKSKKKKVFGAKTGMSFDEKMKAVEQGKIDKKTGKFTSMNAMRESKGFKPGESAQDFNKRRQAISRLGKAAKATKIGKIALGVGALGVAASQLIKKKMQEKKENKKMGGGLAAATAKLKAQGRMGGGMMKKYSVGGGLDMGGPKGKIMQSIKNKKKNSERLTRRDKQFLEDNAKGIPTKAYMGGGMMKKYSTGGDSKLKDDTFKPIFKKSEGAKKELAFEQIDSALSQKNIGSGGMSRRGLMKVVDAAADDKQLERSLRKRLRDTPTKENKKMGGGMMNKPMGYKSGKSIKVKCKLGKNKPTKLY